MADDKIKHIFCDHTKTFRWSKFLSERPDNEITHIFRSHKYHSDGPIVYGWIQHVEISQRILNTKELLFFSATHVRHI